MLLKRGQEILKLEQLLDVKYACRWWVSNGSMNDLGRSQARYPSGAFPAQPRLIGAHVAVSARGQYKIIRSEAPPLGHSQDQLCYCLLLKETTKDRQTPQSDQLRHRARVESKPVRCLLNWQRLGQRVLIGKSKAMDCSWTKRFGELKADRSPGVSEVTQDPGGGASTMGLAEADDNSTVETPDRLDAAQAVPGHQV